jgi:hypothetical protein
MAGPAKLSTGHFTGIGRVVDAWARIEHNLIFCVQALLKSDRNVTAVALWHMGYNDRRDRITALVQLLHEKDDKLKKELRTITDRLDRGYAIRNLAAHGVWSAGTTPDSICPFILKAKGGVLRISGYNEKEEEFTPERFEAEAKTLERLNEDLKEFFGRRFGAKFS